MAVDLFRPITIEDGSRFHEYFQEDPPQGSELTLRTYISGVIDTGPCGGNGRTA